MVDLVLKKPAKELVGLDRHFLAIEVVATDVHLHRSDDPQPEVGNGETPFFVVPLTSRLHDGRVDHHFGPLTHVIDEQPFLHSDLGGGQTGAHGDIHGVHHVIHQAGERPVDLVDVASHLFEHRISIGADRIRGHASHSTGCSVDVAPCGARAATSAGCSQTSIGSTSTRSRPAGRGVDANPSHKVR